MIIKLYEKFTEAEKLEDAKNNIMLKAVRTDNIDIIDFFIKKKFNIEENIIEASMYHDKSFRYLLSKGINLENYNIVNFRHELKDINVQKALIDFGYDYLIYDSVGFNSLLKYDPKYYKVIARFEEQKKYNL